MAETRAVHRGADPAQRLAERLGPGGLGRDPAGQPEQGKKLVDTALAAHPGHPEALYARGLVQLMGLGQLAAGQRDLNAYLANAPFGSHRDTVETLLAMIPKGATK